ncbi:MAG: zinc-binding alcohol dehydrogenase [Thermodesulfobacteriota bacterium]
MIEKRQSLVFAAPGRVEVQEEPIPVAAAGQVLVASRLSAVSAGTELLVFQGLFPDGLAVDAAIPELAGPFAYPLRYGYSLVGEVRSCGPGVDPAWADRRVFAFHPHASHFVAAPDTLLPLPDDLGFADSVFLASMETAVSLVMDGRPLVGERVLVLGQGVVGLLVTGILARFPLSGLVSVDPLPARRRRSRALGARHSLAPGDAALAAAADFDLAFELSGSPAALETAVELTGFAGRIVVGSWYGKKEGRLPLGGVFHRRRQRLFASQVSTVAPEHTGRWTRTRRLELAWETMRRLRPADLISHTLPLAEAPEAYRLLVEEPDRVGQVVLVY